MPTVPYVKQTWTDGASALSAARMGVLEAGIHEISFAPAVRVFHNANQSITHAVSTVLAFNSERFDTAANAADTQHDTVTNNSRLTCKYAGKYQITGNVEFAANATGVREVSIRLNGTTVIGYDRDTAVSAALNHIMPVSTLYDLAVNDYVELLVLQSSGGALNVVAAGNYSPEFMMVRVA